MIVGSVAVSVGVDALVAFCVECLLRCDACCGWVAGAGVWRFCGGGRLDRCIRSMVSSRNLNAVLVLVPTMRADRSEMDLSVLMHHDLLLRAGWATLSHSSRQMHAMAFRAQLAALVLPQLPHALEDRFWGAVAEVLDFLDAGDDAWDEVESVEWVCESPPDVT